MLEVLKKNMICAIFIILNGFFLLLCPILQLTSMSNLFLGSLIFQAISYALLFMATIKEKNYLPALTCLVTIIISIVQAIFNVANTPKHLAITLLIWLLFLSLIKLKKADQYHDKKSKMWQLEIAGLFLFVFTGILTSINFLFSIETSILIFGYFILIMGILDFFDSFLAYLTKGKKIK